MRYSTWKYYFKEGFFNLFKNRLMTLAAILTVTASIFILAVTYCVLENFDYIIEQMENSIGVTVICDDDVEEEDIVGIQAKIATIPEITSISYISKEEAYNRMVEELGQTVMAGLKDDNPLSRSFEITISDVSHHKTVISELNRLDGIKQVNHLLNEVQLISGVTDKLRIGSIAFIVLLAVMSVVIITNTIKISVHSRRNEISIMKYVGATNWFIRWPFVIEGVFIGLIGSLLSLFIVWMFYNQAISNLMADDFIKNWIQFRTVAEISLALLPMCIGLGILIGIAGSGFSVRKYLQV